MLFDIYTWLLVDNYLNPIVTYSPIVMDLAAKFIDIMVSLKTFYASALVYQEHTKSIISVAILSSSRSSFLLEKYEEVFLGLYKEYSKEHSQCIATPIPLRIYFCHVDILQDFDKKWRIQNHHDLSAVCL